MSAPTPGPWVAAGQFVCRADTAEVLAEARLPFNTIDQHEAHAARAANARLISAAPDLLEALRAIEESRLLTYDQALDLGIYAAIAKAEGR